MSEKKFTTADVIAGAAEMEKNSLKPTDGYYHFPVRTPITPFQMTYLGRFLDEVDRVHNATMHRPRYVLVCSSELDDLALPNAFVIGDVAVRGVADIQPGYLFLSMIEPASGVEPRVRCAVCHRSVLVKDQHAHYVTHRGALTCGSCGIGIAGIPSTFKGGRCPGCGHDNAEWVVF